MPSQSKRAASRVKKAAIPPQRDLPTVAEIPALRARMWRKAGGTAEVMLELVRREADERTKSAAGRVRRNGAGGCG